MTITRILALLSVVALLASLPVTVALGQGGGGSDAPPIPPFQVVGNATIDGEPAMDGTMVVAMIDGEKAGTGSVMDGKFSVDVMGEMGAMIMFEFMTGEGDEAMMYKVMSEPGEVMVGHARRAQDRQPHGPGRRHDDRAQAPHHWDRRAARRHGPPGSPRQER